MFESMVSFTMLEHLWGESFVPARGRVGSERHATPLRWPHKTKDGYICAWPSSDKHWQVLRDVAGRPELKDHPIFGDRKARRKNIRKVLDLLDEIFPTRTTAEWAKALSAGGVPCMPIASLEDVVADPHLAEVGFWHEIDHPSEGRIRLMNPPYTLSRTPPSIRRAPPRYGEHTREILAELGYEQAAIDALIAGGGAVEQPKDG